MQSYFSSKYMLYSCSNSLLPNLGTQFTLMISLNPSSRVGGLNLALYWLKRGSLILVWVGSVSSLNRLLCLAWSWVVVITSPLTTTPCFTPRAMYCFLASLSTCVLSTTTLFSSASALSTTLRVFSFPPVLSLLATTTPCSSMSLATSLFPDPWMPTNKARKGLEMTSLESAGSRSGELVRDRGLNGAKNCLVGLCPRKNTSGVK